MRRHVFVSHASAEHDFAEGLCRKLEADGLPCWIAPRDILPGADWAAQIIDGIDAAWAVLLVLGPAANRSNQVRREVERAVHKDIPVLTLRIEELALSKSLEYFLSAHHWIDAFGASLADHQARIGQALRAWREEGDAGAGTHGSPPAVAPPGPAASMARATPAWSAAALAPISERLALALGPVAPVLVARAARTARDEAELLDMLAREIDDPRSRASFVAASRHA
jgi:hypothetical protein